MSKPNTSPKESVPSVEWVQSFKDKFLISPLVKDNEKVSQAFLEPVTVGEVLSVISTLLATTVATTEERVRREQETGLRKITKLIEEGERCSAVFEEVYRQLNSLSTLSSLSQPRKGKG